MAPPTLVVKISSINSTPNSSSLGTECRKVATKGPYFLLCHYILSAERWSGWEDKTEKVKGQEEEEELKEEKKTNRKVKTKRRRE